MTTCGPEHDVPFGTGVSGVHSPVVGSQTPAISQSFVATHVTGVPVQTPEVQTSF